MITELTTSPNGALQERRFHTKNLQSVLVEIGKEKPSLVRIEDKMAFLSNEISELRRTQIRLQNVIQENQLKDAIVKEALQRIASVM